MTEAVVLSAVRTPVGRYGGALSGVRPDDLAAHAVGAAVERAGVDPGRIEDVVLGCANQAGEDNRNVARMALCSPGCRRRSPVSPSTACAPRACPAIVTACHAIRAGDGDLFVAGGVESMSRAPFVLGKADRAFPRGNQTAWDTTLGWRFPNPRLEAMFPLESMGETGENVARESGPSGGKSRMRLRSRATSECRGARAGAVRREIVPVVGVEHDEHPRPDTSAEKLASLKPAFRPDGSVTAGNSSGLNDGAAAVVVASAGKAESLGARRSRGSSRAPLPESIRG